MNRFNQGWRRLNDPPTLWNHIKLSFNQMGRRPATATDWKIFWLCLALGGLYFLYLRS